jgi:imidazoleglycerol-phosphate dehydratase
VKARTARIERTTTETAITVRMNIDGAGTYTVDTGLPFLNHMLELLARHALIDLEIQARGDLDVDAHHTVEDLGLVLGKALDTALGTRRGIARYGWCLLPMDDALSGVAVDLGGRPYLVYHRAGRARKIGTFDLRLLEEFFRAFVTEARMNLHVVNLYGDEPHHVSESMFKGVARALRMAVARDPRETGVPSSKGRI